MNAVTPLVSIIIPVYNGAAWLRPLLGCFKDQTYPHWEAIFVDDGSSDDSLGVLTELTSSEPTRVRFLAKPPEALPALARNYGAKHAKGQYLAFCDVDDLWHPRKLAEQVRIFREYPQLSFCASPAIYFRDSETPSWPKERALSWKFYFGADKLAKKNFIVTSSVFLAKRGFDSIGGFSGDKNLRIGEDYDLFLRLAQDSAFMLSSEPLVAYRNHNSNLTRNSRSLLLLGLQTLSQKDSYSLVMRHHLCRQALKTEARILLRSEVLKACGLLSKRFLLHLKRVRE